MSVKPFEWDPQVDSLGYYLESYLREMPTDVLLLVGHVLSLTEHEQRMAQSVAIQTLAKRAK